MPPRGRKGKKRALSAEEQLASDQERLSKRQVTASSLGQQLQQSLPPPHVSEYRLRLNQIVRDKFEAFIQFGVVVSFLGFAIGSWADLVAATTPTINFAAVNMFIVFLAGLRNAKTGNLRRAVTFLGDVSDFLCCYRLDRNSQGAAHVIDPGVLKNIWQHAKTLIDKNGLKRGRILRAQLLDVSVISLVNNAPQALPTKRTLLSFLILVAILCATGLRQSSVCRANTKIKWEKLSDRRRGLRFRDIRIWIVPNKVDKLGSNDVVVWSRPRFVKGGGGKARTWFPLESTPVLGLSANYLILALLLQLCASQLPSITELLSPDYLKDGLPRQLEIPESIRDEFLVKTRHGMTPNLGTLNRWLRITSRLSGFEKDVTSHCFRHMVAQKVFDKHGLETTRRTLGHSKITATRFYMAFALPDWVSASIFGGSTMDTADFQRISKTNAVPDKNAPSPNLTGEALLEILEDTELVALKIEQQFHKEQLAENYGSIRAAPPDVRAQYKNIVVQYRNRLTKLTEDRWRQEREAYLQRRRTVLSEADLNNPQAKPVPQAIDSDQAVPSLAEEFDIDTFEMIVSQECTQTRAKGDDVGDPGAATKQNSESSLEDELTTLLARDCSGAEKMIEIFLDGAIEDHEAVAEEEEKERMDMEAEELENGDDGAADGVDDGDGDEDEDEDD